MKEFKSISEIIGQVIGYIIELSILSLMYKYIIIENNFNNIEFIDIILYIVLFDLTINHIVSIIYTFINNNKKLKS